jgi:hypothetical protein
VGCSSTQKATAVKAPVELRRERRVGPCEAAGQAQTFKEAAPTPLPISAQHSHFEG